jgi:glucose/arabinose dehydrogenase
VANINSVMRFAYRVGDLQSRGAPQTLVAQISRTTGGHTTRDLAFSADGRRMLISVGSGSNVAAGMSRKTVAQARTYEKTAGLGASWDDEARRADVLTFDPEGKPRRKPFATGIRNCVGLAVHPKTGDLWCSANERDVLGDNLVPDYVTRVREGAFYGWPWYYIGDHEDPRLAGARPDLAGKVTVPDVLLQPHSASLGLTFYVGAGSAGRFPAEYEGDGFAALHGSWNRSQRTGYKVVRVLQKDGVPTGEYEDFLTGFVLDDRSVWGRPVGVAEGKDGELYVTDDGSETLWQIRNDP